MFVIIHAEEMGKSTELDSVKNPEKSLGNWLDVYNLTLSIVIAVHLSVLYYMKENISTPNQNAFNPPKEQGGIVDQHNFLKKIYLKLSSMKNLLIYGLTGIILIFVSIIFLKMVLHLMQVGFLRLLKLDFIFNSKFFKNYTKFCLISYGLFLMFLTYFIITYLIFLSEDKDNEGYEYFKKPKLIQDKDYKQFNDIQKILYIIKFYFFDIFYGLLNSIIFFFKSLFWIHLYDHTNKLLNKSADELKKYGYQYKDGKHLATLFIESKPVINYLFKFHDILIGFILPIITILCFGFILYYLYRLSVFLEIQKNKKEDLSDKILFVL